MHEVLPKNKNDKAIMIAQGFENGLLAAIRRRNLWQVPMAMLYEKKKRRRTFNR